MAANLKRRKIVVLGSRSVGKSSLITRFVDNEFVDSYYPTITKSYNKTLTYNGEKFQCEIIDTAGQDEYTPPNPSHAIGIHGYIFVYSITSRNSFDMIQIVYDKIIEFSGLPDIPCIVVGTKCDLQSGRKVRRVEGEDLAKNNNGAFEEASAKDDVNVSRAFELCLAEIEKKLAGKHAQPGQAAPQQGEKGGCVVM